MLTARYIVTVVTVALGASFQFYSMGVVNQPQSIVETWINASYVARGMSDGLSTSALTLFWSFTTSCICIGACCGCLCMRPLAEHLGRRNGLLANAAWNVAGGLLELLARPVGSPELLLLGRFMLGMCMGLTSGLVPMYLMEISPVRYRGAASTVHQMAVAFSDWFCLLLSLPQILGSPSLWPLAFAFPAIPALGLLIVLPFMPESPRYLLIHKHQRNKAFQAVQALVGKEDAREVFESLVREAIIATSASRDGKASMLDLFRHKSLRAALKISFLVMVAQQFTGCAAVFSFSTNIFMQANLDLKTAQLSTLGIGVAYFIFVIPSAYLIEKAGRRFLSLFQLCGCLVMLGVLSLFVWLQDAFDQQWASYGSIAALVLYMCIYGLGSPVPWMITGELFAQQHRASAVTLSTFTAWGLAFCVTTVYLPLQKLIGPAASFTPFMAVLLLAIIGLFVLLPETKNREIDDIVREFRHRSRTMSRTLTFSNWRQDGKANPELDWLLEESAEHGGSNQTSGDSFGPRDKQSLLLNSTEVTPGYGAIQKPPKWTLDSSIEEDPDTNVKTNANGQVKLF